jgi:hypothetical protein
MVASWGGIFPLSPVDEQRTPGQYTYNWTLIAPLRLEVVALAPQSCALRFKLPPPGR